MFSAADHKRVGGRKQGLLYTIDGIDVVGHYLWSDLNYIVSAMEQLSETGVAVDLGMKHGLTSIVIARALPDWTVFGYDIWNGQVPDRVTDVLERLELSRRVFPGCVDAVLGAKQYIGPVNLLHVDLCDGVKDERLWHDSIAEWSKHMLSGTLVMGHDWAPAKHKKHGGVRRAIDALVEEGILENVEAAGHSWISQRA